MAETSSLGVRVDTEDWVDADLPCVVVAGSDADPFLLHVPVIRVDGWDALGACVDPDDWPVDFPATRH